jgi:hypothetical protein
MADLRPGGLACSDIADLAAGFVLGALDPAQEAAVRDHLAACSEPHPELAELGSIVPALARSAPLAAPRPDLGARILAAARAEAESTAASAVLDAASVPVDVMPPSQVAPAGMTSPPGGAGRPGGTAPPRGFAIPALFRRPAWSIAAVAAVLAIALLGWNLQLQGQVSDLTAYRAGVAAVVDAAAEPGVQLAVLGGASGPSGIAAVDPAGRLVLAMRGLAATNGTEVYEAWLIGANGKPVPAGSFAVGGSGVGTLAAPVGSGDPGVVVALTREPGPGATTPTLPIIAQGQGRAATG